MPKCSCGYEGNSRVCPFCGNVLEPKKPIKHKKLPIPPKNANELWQQWKEKELEDNSYRRIFSSKPMPKKVWTKSKFAKYMHNHIQSNKLETKVDYPKSMKNDKERGQCIMCFLDKDTGQPSEIYFGISGKKWDPNTNQQANNFLEERKSINKKWSLWKTIAEYKACAERCAFLLLIMKHFYKRGNVGNEDSLIRNIGNLGIYSFAIKPGHENKVKACKYCQTWLKTYNITDISSENIENPANKNLAFQLNI